MINYPLGFQNIEKEVSHKSRGMSFESRINKTNEFYLQNKIAIIYKRPTPINVIEFDEASKMITKAVFKEDSTTDYNGVYKGHYIDFEAKSTTSKTSFPLANLQEHQYEHLEEIDEQKGISFLLIEFSALDEIYLIPFKDLSSFLQGNSRQSIPLSWIRKNAFLVNSMLGAYVHYLENVDKIFDL